MYWYVSKGQGIGASIDMYWLVLICMEKMVYIVHICTNLLYCSINCTSFLFIACIGMYWYVSKGHRCKYWYVLVIIGMYRKNGIYCTYLYICVCINWYWPVLDDGILAWVCMDKMVCVEHIYWAVFVSIELYWPVLDLWYVLVCMAFICLYWHALVHIDTYGIYL